MTATGQLLMSLDNYLASPSVPWLSGLEVLNLARQALATQTWTGSWTGSPDNPSAASAIYAMIGAIGAGSGAVACADASRNALPRVSAIPVSLLSGELILCRVAPLLDQGGACAPRAGTCAGLRSWGPARACQALLFPLITGAHPERITDAGRCRLPRRLDCPAPGRRV